MAPAGSSLSRCVGSSDAVLGEGTVPGSFSNELFPSAHTSLRSDPSDTSSSLGKSVGKSHVSSTSPLPPAPQMSCSHALLHDRRSQLRGGCQGPPTHGRLHVWSRGIRPARRRGAAGSHPAITTPPTPRSPPQEPLQPSGNASPASFLDPRAQPGPHLPCPARGWTCPAAGPCQARQPRAKCRSLCADNQGSRSPALLALRGCTE